MSVICALLVSQKDAPADPGRLVEYWAVYLVDDDDGDDDDEAAGGIRRAS